MAKRENRKVNKGNLVEVTGNRTELESFLGQTLECEVFITNSLGYCNEKRLITEVRIPNTKYYIKHLWLKEWNVPLNKVKHGYGKLSLKVVDYWDSETGDVKYGVQYAGEAMRQPKEAKMQIPAWKKEQLEMEALKNESKNANVIAAKAIKAEKIKEALKVRNPFGKVRKIRKVSKAPKS